MSQKLNIQERRKKVAYLWLFRQYTRAEVAKKLNIAPRTVDRDINVINKEFKEDYGKDYREKIILKTIRQSEKQIGESWKLHERISDTKSLKETRESTKAYLDVLERLKLIEKAPDLLEITNRDEKIRDSYERIIKRKREREKVTNKSNGK